MTALYIDSSNVIFVNVIDGVILPLREHYDLSLLFVDIITVCL